jgi:hypothetical protein
MLLAQRVGGAGIQRMRGRQGKQGGGKESGLEQPGTA